MILLAVGLFIWSLRQSDRNPLNRRHHHRKEPAQALPPRRRKPAPRVGMEPREVARRPQARRRVSSARALARRAQRRRAVADLRATDRSRSRIPHHEERDQSASGLAPARAQGGGAHHDRIFGLRHACVFSPPRRAPPLPRITIPEKNKPRCCSNWAGRCPSNQRRASPASSCPSRSERTMCGRLGHLAERPYQEESTSALHRCETWAKLRTQ